MPNQDCVGEFCLVLVEFEWSVFHDELKRETWIQKVCGCMSFLDILWFYCVNLWHQKLRDLPAETTEAIKLFPLEGQSDILWHHGMGLGS